MTSTYNTGTIEVAKNVYAFIQAGGSTDAGFILESDGVVVIDTLMTKSLANQLMDEVRHITEAPIKYIVNTHWHGDHVFGNAVLPQAPIIAHDTCREDLLGEWDNHRAFLRALYPDAWPEMEHLPATPPDVTFDQNITLHLESRPLELLYFGRAHTRGDVVAYLPTEGVVFAGDIAFHKYIPNARDGFPLEWITTSQALENLGADVIVPGHGPIGSNTQLAEMRDCLTLIVEQVRKSYDKGLDEIAARAAINLGPFTDWGRQEDRMPTLVARLYRELKGELG